MLPLLLALAAPALPPQSALNPDEQACIYEALPADQRENIARRFDLAEMPVVLEIATPAADACATTWKWSDDRRTWQIVYTAAYSAMLLLEGDLKGVLDTGQLEALFYKQPSTDQYGFTFQGAQELGDEGYSALALRAGELMAAEKVAEERRDTVGGWFIAYARFAEASAHLKAPPKAD